MKCKPIQSVKRVRNWLVKQQIAVMGWIRPMKIGAIFVIFTSLTFFIVLISYQRKYHFHHRHTLPPTYDWPQDMASHSCEGNNCDPLAYPEPWKLGGVQIQYLINSLVCPSESPVLMIILITSYVGHVDLRNKLRLMIPTHELQNLRIHRLFLLAKPKHKDAGDQSVSYRLIQDEARQHRDVLVGDFEESYKNLTTKHLMGLQWVGRFCPHAELVLKQDDDIIVDVFQLFNLLGLPPFLNMRSKSHNISTILGRILSKQKVEREPGSKWYVSKADMEMDYFPSFVSGWGYLITPNAAQLLVAASANTPSFWIDDAYITGILRDKTEVSLMELGDYFTHYKGHLQCCVATAKNKVESHAHSPYWCDYLIGPPNGDTELMQYFYTQSRICHFTKVCLRRQQSEMLKNTCVITPGMVVNDFSLKAPSPSSFGVGYVSVRKFKNRLLL